MKVSDPLKLRRRSRCVIDCPARVDDIDKIRQPKPLKGRGYGGYGGRRLDSREGQLSRYIAKDTGSGRNSKAVSVLPAIPSYANSLRPELLAHTHSRRIKVSNPSPSEPIRHFMLPVVAPGTECVVANASRSKIAWC